jgi:hypothetical protein
MKSPPVSRLAFWLNVICLTKVPAPGTCSPGRCRSALRRAKTHSVHLENPDGIYRSKGSRWKLVQRIVANRLPASSS